MELRVRRATAKMEDGRQIDDDPKSEAGKRPISLPSGLRHATHDRDHAIAAALDALIEEARDKVSA
ncbi:hypothetical protein [Micromonospora sp. NPDC001898]|uniref:hypothetical protein n=1 Tax=Micromonospora sp. NPDC001898 TaxID=3364221 RepID=UPI00367E95C7